MVKQSGPDKRPVTLLWSLDEAKSKIQSQLTKGRALKLHSSSIVQDSVLTIFYGDLGNWQKYTYELLLRMFDSRDVAEEFDSASKLSVYFIPAGGKPLSERIAEAKRQVNKSVSYLEGLFERLELYTSSTEVSSKDIEQYSKVSVSSKKVFIVHGHDNEAKETVARFTEKVGLEAIILHEQANAGKTVIEKIEAHSEVGFAVVLLTPDDMGHSIKEPEKVQPRARQNVIFELGYFTALLGRSRVVALYRGNVEILSDYQGVLYISWDDAGYWRYALGKELKAAGIDVDMNNI